jgi:hypothetical protein
MAAVARPEQWRPSNDAAHTEFNPRRGGQSTLDVTAPYSCWALLSGLGRLREVCAETLTCRPLSRGTPPSDRGQESVMTILRHPHDALAPIARETNPPSAAGVHLRSVFPRVLPPAPRGSTLRMTWKPNLKTGRLEGRWSLCGSGPQESATKPLGDGWHRLGARCQCLAA